MSRRHVTPAGSQVALLAKQVVADPISALGFQDGIHSSLVPGRCKHTSSVLELMLDKRDFQWGGVYGGH